MMSSVRAALCAYCHFVVQSFGSRMTVCVKVLFNMGRFKARQIPVDLVCPPKDQGFFSSSLCLQSVSHGDSLDLI